MENLLEKSYQYPQRQLNRRELCDLELILNGGFHPLKGFVNEQDYYSILNTLRLLDGTLFPIPICLSVNEELKNKLINNKFLTLKDEQNFPLAILQIETIYKPNIELEITKTLGIYDENHPYFEIIQQNKNNYYVGGTLQTIMQPRHYDYQELRLSPTQTKQLFSDNKYEAIIGFQTRNPMHKSHFHLTLNAVSSINIRNSLVLLHPVVGETQDGDINYHVRVKCYQKILKYYKQENVNAVLSLLNLSMRMAGPREALLHAIIRQNYGCTHFIVGRDHAGPSTKAKNGKKFYENVEAQQLLKQYENELKIKIICSDNIVFVKNLNQYKEESQVNKDQQIEQLSGTQQRLLLSTGKNLPDWFTFPKIQKILKQIDYFQGFCVYFCGLSGSGKSILMNALRQKLSQIFFQKTIKTLDADEVRNNVCQELGFSKKDRSMNVRRIGYISSLLVEQKSIVLVANIAPFLDDRQANKQQIKKFGGYIQIFVNTSLEECKKRDCKGLYKLAEEDKIKLTGVNDLFESPENDSDLIVDGSNDIDSNIKLILKFLQDNKYLN